MKKIAILSIFAVALFACCKQTVQPQTTDVTKPLLDAQIIGNDTVYPNYGDTINVASGYHCVINDTATNVKIKFPTTVSGVIYTESVFGGTYTPIGHCVNPGTPMSFTALDNYHWTSNGQRGALVAWARSLN